MFQPSGLQPNLRDNIERPLRYTPDGQDFVIENGGEFFNRPLYGGNTAFRVDAGDMPEFSLYLPGRGGNLRFGLRAADGKAKWLHEAARITARYRPGEMLYEIRDPILGENAVLRLHAIALYQTEGLIVRVDAENLPVAPALELLAAYGGVNGKRGKRDGDIGTESVPISEYFQLQPEACRDNKITLGETPGQFTLSSPAAKATLVGQFPANAKLAIADASYGVRDFSPAFDSGIHPAASAPDGGPMNWPVESGTEVPHSTKNRDSSATQTPILISATPLAASTPLYFCIQRAQNSSAKPADEPADYTEVTVGAPPPTTTSTAAPPPLAPPSALQPFSPSALFSAAEQHFAALRNQVTVDTPDPFINAAVAALNVAADAVWDEPQGAVMHGAVAWRVKLLGWRGPYAMDALGWHDRARRHLSYWATRQNTSPIPDKLPPPDENSNLSRSEAALHSNGDIANSHYDMNTVYIDALFRHILWTGDLDFARQMWPVIERHLAWQRRLFRREFGPDKLPLYEAYAQIWASDDLQYNGGGATTATAYNYYHNTLAARLARALGYTDRAAFYENEAALISRAAQKYLWLPEQGMFAEYRDLLGLQRAHPSAGLWSFYHAMDCGLITPDEMPDAVRYVNTHYPAIPVRGPSVPKDERYQVLSSTDWMPYTWSINNVVMGENIHTALALWQADDWFDAFSLMKSSLLASMFMGICPGNVGSLNYLDVYRRESQRDFADGSGVTSRAIVEGLFGIHPDALANELTIAPGFPQDWTHVAIKHPDVSYTYDRANGVVEKFTIEQHGPRPMPVTLRLFALRGTATVKCVTTGETWTLHCQDPFSDRHITIGNLAPAKKLEVEITWSGMIIIIDPAVPSRKSPAAPFDWHAPLPPDAKLAQINLAPYFNDRVTQIFKNEYREPRSPYVSLAIPKQGVGGWAGSVNARPDIDDSGLRAASAQNGGVLRLPNGVTFATPGDAAPGSGNARLSRAVETRPESRPPPPNIIFTSLWKNYPAETVIPLQGRARHAYFLMAGSTNWMQSRIDNGEVIITYEDGTTARLALRNPDTWWPIEQDMFYDDYQFRCDTPPPPRVNLKTGEIRILDADTFKGKGRAVPGGAATILHLPLDPQKQLRSLTLRTLSNEVVIGLMAATLESAE